MESFQEKNSDKWGFHLRKWNAGNEACPFFDFFFSPSMPVDRETFTVEINTLCSSKT